MTNAKMPASRDEILLAFHEAYIKPSATEVAEWVAKYPQFAEDIIAHAAVAYEFAAAENLPTVEISKSRLDAAFSRALSAMYEAEREAEQTAANAKETLSELASAQGKDVRAIHREIEQTQHIDRGVLADLFSGAMLGPLTNRFSSAVRRALDVSLVRFEAAHQRTVLSPRLGFASAQATPTIRQRPCAEIIRSSDMTEEQIRYWLDETA